MNLPIMIAAHGFEAFMALLIPIIAIVLGIGVVFVAIITDYKRKRNLFELHHKERLAAIEKGMEVPPLPAGLLSDIKPHRRPQDYFRVGVIWLLVGIALWPVLREVAGDRWQWIGLIPAAVGLGNLIYYFAIGRHEKPAPPADPAKPAVSASRPV